MRFLILDRSVGRIEKKNLMKIIRSLGIGGLVPQHQQWVVAKLRERGKKDQMPKLLCDTKMVWKRRYQFFLFFFFFENAKVWVGRTTLNGEKEGDGLSNKTISSEIMLLILIIPLLNRLAINTNKFIIPNYRFRYILLFLLELLNNCELNSTQTSFWMKAMA